MRRSLLETAQRYIEIIENLGKQHDKKRLMELEEERVIWHNQLIEELLQEGIPFKDREHVTRIAYRIVAGDL